MADLEIHRSNGSCICKAVRTIAPLPTPQSRARPSLSRANAWRFERCPRLGQVRAPAGGHIATNERTRHVLRLPSVCITSAMQTPRARLCLRSSGAIGATGTPTQPRQDRHLRESHHGDDRRIVVHHDCQTECRWAQEAEKLRRHDVALYLPTREYQRHRGEGLPAQHDVQCGAPPFAKIAAPAESGAANRNCQGWRRQPERG